jgi:flagellin-like protein
MDLRRKTRKKAVSPVIATIMLLAVTLIAGVFLAGFTFQVMGSFTTFPLVSANVESCSGSPVVCGILLRNSGSGSTAATGCSFGTTGGDLYNSNGTRVHPPEEIPVPAGANTLVECEWSGTPLFVSGSVSGSIQLASTALSIPFYGSVSET